MNIHNTNANYLGTGEVLFSPEATSVEDAHKKGYYDLGNIVSVSQESSTEKQEHIGNYRGVKRVDKTAITKADFVCKISCDEWDMEKLKFILFGTNDGFHTQAVQANASGKVWAFAISNASQENRWYDVMDSSGNRLRDLQKVTIATLTEGTDFEADLKLSKVRFLKTQSAARTPKIDAPAITATSSNTMNAIKPFSQTMRRGFGRVGIKAKKETNWEKEGLKSLEESKSFKTYAHAKEGEIDRAIEENLTLKDPLGRKVIFGEELKKHFQEKSSVEKRSRGGFLEVAKDAIKNPIEMWSDKKNDVYVKTFLSKDKKGKEVKKALVLFAQKNGEIHSYFERELEAADVNRTGEKLIYKEKEE